MDAPMTPERAAEIEREIDAAVARFRVPVEVMNRNGDGNVGGAMHLYTNGGDVVSARDEGEARKILFDFYAGECDPHALIVEQIHDETPCRTGGTAGERAQKHGAGIVPTVPT